MDTEKTGSELIPTESALATLRPIMEQAQALSQRSKADATIKAYSSDWKHFDSWCRTHGLVSLPATPETVALYLTSLVESAKTSTIQRRASAISQAHQLAGHDSPTHTMAVKTLLAGIRRTKGVAQKGKAPTLTADIRGMLATLPDTPLGIRDRALLLLGFAGGFRRSELVSLKVLDLVFSSDGLAVTIRRSKTDQEGEGRKVGIPFGSSPETCPVRSVQAWLRVSGITEGPVFRSINRHGQLQATALTSQVVALIVKRAADIAGLDPAKYAGHSLRAGLATQAAANGASERSIMGQTGHRSVTMVRKYIREGSLFRENAGGRLGL